MGDYEIYPTCKLCGQPIKLNSQILKENAQNNVIKYCLDEEKLNEEFKKEYLSKRDEEFNALRDIKDEVEAQLSLSNDLEYQQEVLIRYGIIDKKTKKISE